MDDARQLRIGAISLDCADPRALADFYVALLDAELRWVTPTAAGVRAGPYVLVTQLVSGYCPPVWPGASILHLDLTGAAPVIDLVDHAVGCGARVAAHQPDQRWTVLLDPAGHPFCITPFAPAPEDDGQ